VSTFAAYAAQLISPIAPKHFALCTRVASKFCKQHCWRYTGILPLPEAWDLLFRQHINSRFRLHAFRHPTTFRTLCRLNKQYCTSRQLPIDPTLQAWSAPLDPTSSYSFWLARITCSHRSLSTPSLCQTTCWVHATSPKTLAPSFLGRADRRLAESYQPYPCSGRSPS
jgi:hypothetical protein